MRRRPRLRRPVDLHLAVLLGMWASFVLGLVGAGSSQGVRLTVAAGVFTLVVGWAQVERGRRDRLLVARQGPEAVPDLAAVLLTQPFDPERGVAERAMRHLLPRLDRPTHLAMTEAERARVRLLLPETASAPLVLELLAAFERVSDIEALPAVRLVASGGSALRDDDRVLAAARSCAAFLEEAARQKRDAETLLRPADGAPTDTLLRPAGGAPTEPAEQLLRPAADDDEARR